MTKIVDEVVGLIVAVLISVTFISIGLTTNTPLSPAFIMGGGLGLLMCVVGIFGLGKGRS